MEQQILDKVNEKIKRSSIFSSDRGGIGQICVESTDYVFKSINDYNKNDDRGDSLAITVMQNNRFKGINLNHDEMEYLIKNSDLNYRNKVGRNLLMCAFAFNMDENINLKPNIIEYLIMNSDCRTYERHGWNNLMFAIVFNSKSKLNISNDCWEYLIQNSSLNFRGKMKEYEKNTDYLNYLALKEKFILNKKIKVSSAIKASGNLKI